MRKRNHQIIVRLDDEELLMLKRKIHRSDLTMAEYFRLLIENGELKMIDQDVQHDMRRKLQGIAVNINQMARLAHISGNVDTQTLKKISGQLEKIEDKKRMQSDLQSASALYFSASAFAISSSMRRLMKALIDSPCAAA